MILKISENLYDSLNLRINAVIFENSLYVKYNSKFEQYENIVFMQRIQFEFSSEFDVRIESSNFAHTTYNRVIIVLIII